MGIKLKWGDVSAQALDAIEIYRATTPISSSNPGSPLVTLAGTAQNYEDNTITNKSLYYYRVAAKKGTERAWGDNLLAGYYAETGPGRSTPLRGDWDVGLMDLVPAANFITNAQLRAKVPALAALTVSNEPTNWYKFFRKGKVLFIPDTTIVSANWNQLYNAGLMYGTDDVGVKPSGVAAGTVNQKTVVNINGLNYILRCPRLSPLGFDQFITTQAQTEGSEWRDTMGRCLLAGMETQPNQKTRLYDATAIPLVFSPHYTAASAVLRTGAAAAPETLNSIALTAGQAVAMVLELIMP